MKQSIIAPCFLVRSYTTAWPISPKTRGCQSGKGYPSRQWISEILRGSLWWSSIDTIWTLHDVHRGFDQTLTGRRLAVEWYTRGMVVGANGANRNPGAALELYNTGLSAALVAWPHPCEPTVQFVLKCEFQKPFGGVRSRQLCCYRSQLPGGGGWVCLVVAMTQCE